MKVIALQEGFFAGSRRRAGETFDVDEGTTGSWFAPAPREVVKTDNKPAGRSKAAKEGQPSQADADTNSNDLV